MTILLRIRHQGKVFPTLRNQSSELQQTLPSCSLEILATKRKASYYLTTEHNFRISHFTLDLVCINILKKFFIYFHFRGNYTSLKFKTHLQFHSYSFIPSCQITAHTLLLTGYSCYRKQSRHDQKTLEHVFSCDVRLLSHNCWNGVPLTSLSNEASVQCRGNIAKFLIKYLKHLSEF